MQVWRLDAFLDKESWRGRYYRKLIGNMSKNNSTLWQWQLDESRI
jgi:hypothetical protein